MSIEHELREHVARLRLMGDFLAQHDVNLLIVTVGDYMQHPDCWRIEIDLGLVFKISPLAVGALSALEVMAGIQDKSLTVVGAHGKVRTALDRQEQVI